MTTPKQVAPIPKEVEKALEKAPELGLERLDLTASTLEIRNDEDFQRAGELLRGIQTSVKKWTAYWAPVVTAAKAAYDIAKAQRDEPLKQAERIRKDIEGTMSDYKEDQARKRAQVEAQRKKQAEFLVQQAEEAARAALIAGRVNEAEIHQRQAELISVDPKLPNTEERIEGVPQVEVYDVEVTDLMALLIAVADGTVPLYGTVMKKTVSLFDVRESVIKAAAASQGDNFNWPGVKLTKRTGFRPRSN